MTEPRKYDIRKVTDADDREWLCHGVNSLELNGGPYMEDANAHCLTDHAWEEFFPAAREFIADMFSDDAVTRREWAGRLEACREQMTN